MNIKMIVTDLDGTLLREDKTISKRTIYALEKCREKGIKILYATARGNSSKILAPSELFHGFVRLNGATAYIGDSIVYNKLIPIDNVRELLIAADNAGINIAAEFNGIHYANFNVTKKWPWIKYYKIANFKELDIEAEKLYAIAETPQVIELIKKYLPKDLYLYVSRDNLAMVMQKEAMKSKAVAVIAEYWSINSSEIVAFGDDTNDLDLLQYCGASVAVANALNEVKDATNYICDTNDNDGVAKWIEENIL